MIYFGGFAWLLVAAVGVAIVVSPTDANNVGHLGWLLISLGCLGAFWKLLSAWITQWTTEIAVTDKRIIHKVGLIQRKTIEMNMSRVESVSVDQSIHGRLLGYGDISVRGTGSGLSPFILIAHPLEFRNAVVVH